MTQKVLKIETWAEIKRLIDHDIWMYVNSQISDKVTLTTLAVSDIQSLIDEYQLDEVLVQTKLDGFKNYCGANGKIYKDYTRAFRHWLRSEEYGRTGLQGLRKIGVSKSGVDTMKATYSRLKAKKEEYKELYGTEETLYAQLEEKYGGDDG